MVTKKRKAPSVVDPSADIRYDKTNHFPIYEAKQQRQQSAPEGASTRFINDSTFSRNLYNLLHFVFLLIYLFCYFINLFILLFYLFIYFVILL